MGTAPLWSPGRLVLSHRSSLTSAVRGVVPASPPGISTLPWTQAQKYDQVHGQEVTGDLRWSLLELMGVPLSF